MKMDKMVGNLRWEKGKPKKNPPFKVGH